MLGKLASGTGRSLNWRLRAPALSGRLRTVAGGRGTGAAGAVANICVVAATLGLRCGKDPP